MRSVPQVTGVEFRPDDAAPQTRASSRPRGWNRTRWSPIVVRRCRLPLAVVIFAAACQPQGQERTAGQAAVDTAAVRTTIDSLRAAWEKGVGAGDFKSMATMLADGAVMVGPGGPAWDSLAAGGSGAPFPPGATIDITPLEVRVMSPEWAYEFGSSTVTYTPQGTDQPRKLKDTYLILFRNTANGWKVYREVASSKAPPKARPPAR
jgi:ketosteroid isomerase-like protein